MLCSKCGTEGIPGKKFCAECGSPLAKRCPNCKADNAAGAKFCADCGTALNRDDSAENGGRAVADRDGGIHLAPETAAAEAVEGERKTVTALFADIKGSTELMEDLDPEEARAIIDPALKLMIDAAHRYDGYVVQSTGDGIFALFGAPVAHEDHPQRALYAALRMQEELKRYSAQVTAGGGTPIQSRVGINTGEVVVRSIHTGAGQVEYTPIGHTTNLASRMQTAAPVGSIAVSEATRKLCEGYFILKPLGATKVKGVSEPVNMYEVAGLGPLRTRLQRSAARGLSKFVGREHEIEALKHASAQVQGGHGQIVATMAEAGVGKSRLFFEFKATSQAGWMVLETFSVSHGKASAYLPVIDVLHNYFRIASDDDERTRREKVAGRIAVLDRGLEDTLPYLSSLLGIVEGDDALAQMDGLLRKRRTLDAIKRVFLRESMNQPLMVIFEDLHWIDDETQTLLNLLADSIGTAKVLLLVNYRPEYSHQWNNKTYYTQLRLDPLGKESAEAMLSALVGDRPEMEPVKRLIVERTGANPFFMEETVQALLDEGALVRHGVEVRLSKPLAELKIPGTVQAILAARVDRLPADQKDLLQMLAVLGKEFTLSHLKTTASASDAELERMLGALQMAEFIYEQPAAGAIEYVFKHALTQEVAYNSLLAEQRKVLHGRAGAALEEMFAGQMEDHLDELAHHYGRSGNILKAINYLKLTAQRAGRRSAYEEAIGSLEKAIAMLASIPESRERDLLELELRVAHGPLYAAIRGFATAEMGPHIRRMEDLCAKVGESPAIVGVLYALWSVNLARARLMEAMPQAVRLLKVAAPLADPLAVGGAHAAMGVTAMWLGEFLPAREHLEQTVAIFDRDLTRYLPMPLAPVIPTLCQLAWTLWILGYPEQANRTIGRALALADQLKRPFNRAFALQYAIPLDDFQRNYAAAQTKIATLIEISRENGFTAWIDSANLSLGRALVFNGESNNGLAMMVEALAGMREHGSELVRTFSLPLVAGSFLRSDQIDGGLDIIEEAVGELETSGARIQEAEAYRIKGELLVRRQTARNSNDLASDGSNITAAQRCFEMAIEVARTQSAKAWELRAAMGLARLWAKLGRRKEARTMLAEIYGWFTEGLGTADLKNAKALIEELSG